MYVKLVSVQCIVHVNVQMYVRSAQCVCTLYVLVCMHGMPCNGMHCIDMSTSKSGAYLYVLCTLWLAYVLRATTACTLSTSQLYNSGPNLVSMYLRMWRGNVLRAMYSMQLYVMYVCRPGRLGTRSFSVGYCIVPSSMPHLIGKSQCIYVLYTTHFAYLQRLCAD